MHSRVDTRRAATLPVHRVQLPARPPAEKRRAAGRLSTLVVVLVAGAGFFCSCAAEQSRENDGVSASQFKDVVVPAGLRLLDGAHESHSIEAASWRLGHFVYSGSVPDEEAASYVRQRMPQHNWELVVDERVDENTTKLRFLRGHYAAEYRFIRQDGRTQMVVDYQTDYARR